MEYKFNEIEQKWQDYWKEKKIYQVSNEHATRRDPTSGAKIKDFTCFAVFLPSSKRLPAQFIFIHVYDEW